MKLGPYDKGLWPIFVPSKGRSGKSSLLAAADAEGWPVTVVVEPQEADLYRAAFRRLPFHVLPKNDQGIAYVRRRILRSNKRWYWMFDDDITGFFRVEGKRLRVCDAAEALFAAQGAAISTVGQVALEYGQFAWSAGGRPKVNGYADVCVGIDASRAKAIDYRREIELKEDRDFTMQLIASGIDVIRCTTHAFEAPKNGSNKGGLFDEYAKQGREKRSVEALIKQWPWCASMQTKKDGRLDAKIDWKRIRRQ